VLGTLGYELIGALAFPLAKTSAAISTTSSTRLLARLLVAVGVAAGSAALAVQHPLAKRVSSPTP
jgi:hypothetical protein